ncbi:MAG: sigma-70 family RNA polymerase sigma factor [Planctomycetes bacterium]|nr:sigma-70 family RNA polymerase sigma factor [Planctomycetota bacterium]
MDSGALIERLKGVPDFPDPEAFDPSNDLHVDEAARVLLDRFRQVQDTEAFTLLFELTHDRLTRIASRITSRIAPNVEPDDLAAGFMARLFADLNERRDSVRRFLALAYTSMKNEVFDQLRQQKRAVTGGLRYQDALDDPRDPAQVAQDDEEHDLLARYGRQIVELTAECFSDLETRDQRVLVAREIVGFSYDRVASMLELDGDQVGMIIRRARQHLADRLLERLAGTERLPRETLASIQEVVVRRLGGRDRVKDMRALIRRMLDLSASEGRRRLADLVYELAKACLLSVKRVSERTLVQAPPRRRDVVLDDVRHLARRLTSVGHDDVDVSPLAEPPRSGDGALDDTRACLAVLAHLESTSGRQQVALALCHIHAGEHADAEGILRRLLEVDLPTITRQNVFRNLMLALLRQDRFEEALAVADDCADEWPDDPVRIMNVCFATARLQRAERFVAAARRLLEVQREHPAPVVGSWIDHELPHLARHMGIGLAQFGTSDARDDEEGTPR